MKYLTIRSYRYKQTPFRIQLSWGWWKGKADGTWRGRL